MNHKKELVRSLWVELFSLQGSLDALYTVGLGCKDNEDTSHF